MSLMTHIARPLLALSLLALAAACQRDAAPPPRGTFSLVRTGAGELPALLGSDPLCRYEAVGGSVELKPENEYEAILHRRRSCNVEELGPDTIFIDRGRGTFTVEGDSVFFRFASSGASAGFGVLRGDSLVVQGTGQTMYYRRAAEP